MNLFVNFGLLFYMSVIIFWIVFFCICIVDKVDNKFRWFEIVVVLVMFFVLRFLDVDMFSFN